MTNQTVNDLLEIVDAQHVVTVKVCRIKNNTYQLIIVIKTNSKAFTKYAKSMLRLNRLGRRIAKHRHHVQEVFERTITILAAAEHLADAIAKRVDAQLRILQNLVHRELRVLVVAHLFRGQLLELFVGTALKE